MSSGRETLLLVFAKFPQAGLVKTRLGRQIGFERAAQLYRAFLTDLALRFSERSRDLGCDIRWVYLPAESEFPRLVASIQGRAPSYERTSFVGYREPGLLQQQLDQFTWARQRGYRRVVGISSDTPHLPSAYVVDAFERLASYDVVIGPTLDGGYYLLGTSSCSSIQRDIEMSTDHVAQDLLEAAQDLNLEVCLLPTMLDVDEVQDLSTLVRLIVGASHNPCPATWRVLQEDWERWSTGAFLGLGDEQ